MPAPSPCCARVWVRVPALGSSLSFVSSGRRRCSRFSAPVPDSRCVCVVCVQVRREAEDAAQLVSPVVIQLLSTPFHLYALDLYNRKAAAASDRVRLVLDKYAVSVAARCARILPAFGIGGVANRFFRARRIE